MTISESGTSQSIEEREQTISTRGVIVLAVIIVASWAISGFLINKISANDRGTFGDMFGAINALFSGLALAGVVVAIILQRQELMLQRDELVLNRNELQKSAAAQVGTAEAIREQLKIAKDSARLSALASLVGYYTDMSQNHGGSTTGAGIMAKEKLTTYVNLLEHYFSAGEITVESLSSATKGIGATSGSKSSDPLFLGIAELDPNIALVALRIEIERRLRTLGKLFEIVPTRSLRDLLKELLLREVLPGNVAGSLSELIAFGNQAAHGAYVDPGATEWALENGKSILSYLDELLEKSTHSHR